MQWLKHLHHPICTSNGWRGKTKKGIGVEDHMEGSSTVISTGHAQDDSLPVTGKLEHMKSDERVWWQWILLAMALVYG